MRIIGLFAMCLWLGACTTTPLFPPEVLKDIEANTFDAKAWEEEAYHPSISAFVPHKVELAGEIIKVIRKPDSVVILTEERPLEAHLASSLTSLEQGGSPWFAITFKGSVEPRMLQAGNRLIAVGTTNRVSAEMFGGAPRALPHLMAQCLHIWNTEGVKNMHVYSASGLVGEYPPEEQISCIEENKKRSLSTGDDQSDETKVTTGS